MSSLPDRRDSPRRRISRGRGGMMPGYFVMFTAWISGIFSIVAFLAWVEWLAMKNDIWNVVCVAGAAMILFAMSARKAEKLVDMTEKRDDQ